MSAWRHSRNHQLLLWKETIAEPPDVRYKSVLGLTRTRETGKDECTVAWTDDRSDLLEILLEFERAEAQHQKFVQREAEGKLTYNGSQNDGRGFF